ncbi:hypothetical protein VOM14_23735 [Paraburkholderia sp. MPAMCS5]|uniref:hypothetical protein n=1 Tax=Paraburkholderia sp. MPAMCS5 TaxID=3112563 RepID=UPI002E18C382|nr:hypothetical protein [Paraburkholderia sp. MPAMCS5]
MSTCPLHDRSMRMRPNASRLFAIVTSLMELAGWRALRDLLNVIPDSNDDFGLF